MNKIATISCIVFLLQAVSCAQNVSPPPASGSKATTAEQTSDSLPRDSQYPGSRVLFDAPQGWSEETPDSDMRSAQYSIPVEGGEDLRLLVFFFGEGQGGDVEANLARWAGQFPEATEEKRFQIETPIGPATAIELAGTWVPGPMSQSGPRPSSRMLAAVLETRGGNRYVRLVGEDAAVAKQRRAFRDFLKSARWAS